MADELITCLTCRLRVALSRGCCERCYYRHWQAVARREATWPDLERRGLVMPARPRGYAWRDWKMGRQLSAKPTGDS